MTNTNSIVTNVNYNSQNWHIIGPCSQTDGIEKKELFTRIHVDPSL